MPIVQYQNLKNEIIPLTPSPLHNHIRMRYSCRMKTKPLTLSFCLATLFFFSASSIAFADGYQDALDAYNRKDYKTARKLWSQLAEEGHAASKFFLLSMDYLGQGVPDHKAAYKLLLPLAEQGNATAQFFLGLMHDNEQISIKDENESLRWFRLAAEQGNILAKKIVRAIIERRHFCQYKC